jgi:hypothetical protein
MGGVETLLELILLVLLIATLLHTVRLHRALGAMRQDRATLMDAVEGFDSGTRQAEAGLGRLRDAADQVGGQLAHAAALKDDLEFLSARGEQLADRLDALVRAARTLEPPPQAEPPRVGWAPAPAAAPIAPAPIAPAASAMRSQAERDLLLALRGGLR